MLSSSRRRVVLALSALLCLFAVPSSAQTSVYITAQSAAGVYPATCTTATLSCAASGTGYTCTGGTTAGTHYYYPSATAPTFVSTLVTGQPPALCEQYTADFALPLTAKGLNVQYGTSSSPVCVNYRVYNATTGVLVADPDAVDAVGISFNYSATAASVPTCPAPVAATGSGSATVYFAYLGLNGSASSTICGAGSLSCTYYGNNQYYCPTLLSGTHYLYNSSTAALQTVQLTGELECNGFGDGYLPLDYEGISLGGQFSSQYNCISWYGEGAGVAGYDFYTIGSTNVYKSYGGQRSFSYSTSQASAAAVCAQYIPGLSNGATRPASATMAALIATLAAAALTTLLLL